MKEQSPKRFSKTSNQPSGNPKPTAQPDRGVAAEKKQAIVLKQDDPVTTVEAKIDVGLGNTVFIRGQGAGLSWDAGQPLTCRDASTWIWCSNRAKNSFTFKLLLNDQIWAHGGDVLIEPGTRIELAPQF